MKRTWQGLTIQNGNPSGNWDHPWDKEPAITIHRSKRMWGKKTWRRGKEFKTAAELAPFLEGIKSFAVKAKIPK